MDYFFDYVNVSTNKRLEAFVKEKLKQLNMKFPFIHRAHIFFKTENLSPDNKANCVIRLSIPGPWIVAETQAGNFENAIVKTIDDLDRQLVMRKEIMKN